MPIIFSAYLVDLSVDTTVLWQLKPGNIRTSWNRLRAFIKHMKSTCRRYGRNSPDKKMNANIHYPLVKAEGGLGCRTLNTEMEFENGQLGASLTGFCTQTGEWPEQRGL